MDIKTEHGYSRTRDPKVALDSSPVWTSSSWPQVASRPACQSIPHLRHHESSPLSCFNRAHMPNGARQLAAPWLSCLILGPREHWLTVFLPAGAWRTGVGFIFVGQGLGCPSQLAPASRCLEDRSGFFPVGQGLGVLSQLACL